MNDFECPRCGHCCHIEVYADDTSQERVDEKEKREHEWVGLTDEEVCNAIDDVLEGGGWLDVARAIEQALKEKNHG